MEDAVYINPDQVALERFGDWNSVESVMNAARYCEQWREKCLLNNNSLIFETVLSSEGKLDFIRRAHEAGFFIRLFFVATVHPSINAVYGNRNVYHLVIEKCTTFQLPTKLDLIQQTSK